MQDKSRGTVVPKGSNKQAGKAVDGWHRLVTEVSAQWAVLREMKTAGVECRAKLDRVQVECEDDPRPALRILEGFQPGRSVFPRQHYNDRDMVAYGHAQWFSNSASGVKFNIEDSPRRPFLSPWRATIGGSDRTGLMKKHLVQVLAAIPGFKLTIVELAFDFGIEFAQRKILRRSVLFGKSVPSGRYNDTHYWGAKKGSKLVRMYWKREIEKFRVELELHARFLRYYGIEDTSDFSKLATLLPGKHIWFAQLSTARLRRYLRRKGTSRMEMQQIGDHVADFNASLFTCIYGLRFELKNARRMLKPVWLNGLVREALAEWARQWPTKAIRLEKSKSKVAALPGTTQKPRKA